MPEVIFLFLIKIYFSWICKRKVYETVGWQTMVQRNQSPLTPIESYLWWWRTRIMMYGFVVRTLEEYEEYSGLHFGKRGVQQYTLDAYPPNQQWIHFKPKKIGWKFCSNLQTLYRCWIWFSTWKNYEFWW